MKLVIITGTSQGLGKSFFKYFSTSEYTILSISRRFLPGQVTLQKKNKSKIILHKCDLQNLNKSTLNKLQKLLNSRLIEHLIFINNAGTIQPIGGIGNLNEKEIKNSIAVNFEAPVLVTNYIFSAIQNIKKIDIVNISSGAAVKPMEGWAMYCSGKAAARMYFEVLRTQYKDNPGIKIHNVDPGIIDTGMQTIIRSSSAREFPRVKEFKQFKKDRKLQSPDNTVLKIIGQINE